MGGPGSGGRRARAGRKPGGKPSGRRLDDQIRAAPKAAELLPHEVLLEAARNGRLLGRNSRLTPMQQASCANAAAPFFAPRLGALAVATTPALQFDPERIDTRDVARRIAFVFTLAKREEQAKARESLPRLPAPAPEPRIIEKFRHEPTGHHVKEERAPADHARAYSEWRDETRSSWTIEDWTAATGVPYASLQGHMAPRSLVSNDLKDRPVALIVESPAQWRARMAGEGHVFLPGGNGAPTQLPRLPPVQGHGGGMFRRVIRHRSD